VVIFLTDGKPEISQPYASYEPETLDTARVLNVPIDAIALTSQGQSAFFEPTCQKTGGTIIPAQSANDLLDSYMQILGALKDRTVIGAGISTAAAGSPSVARAITHAIRR